MIMRACLIAAALMVLSGFAMADGMQRPTSDVPASPSVTDRGPDITAPKTRSTDDSFRPRTGDTPRRTGISASRCPAPKTGAMTVANRGTTTCDD